MAATLLLQTNHLKLVNKIQVTIYVSHNIAYIAYNNKSGKYTVKDKTYTIPTIVYVIELLLEKGWIVVQ